MCVMIQQTVKRGHGYQNRKRCTKCDMWVPLVWLKCGDCGSKLRTKRRNMNKVSREKRDKFQIDVKRY